MDKFINVGVVGCGYWGPNLVRNLRTMPGCSVRMVCDNDRARLKHMRSLYPEIEAHSDYSRMLNCPGLDAVVIATSITQHYKMARESLLAGKHTFVEKPLATSSRECAELMAIAQAKGLVLMVGHTFLFSAAVRKIKEIIQQGDLGEIRYISSRRLNLGLFQKDINVVWDLAPHDISVILYLMEEFPLHVNCQGHAHVRAGVEDVASMSLTFRKGRFATIQSSWLDPRKVREMTIVGSRQMIVYDDVQPSEKIRIYDVRVETPPHYDTFGEFHYSYHYGDSYLPYIKQEEPLKVECQHFLDCIKNGTRPLADGEMGRDVVRVLEAASASLDKNGAAIGLARDGKLKTARSRQ